MGEILTTELVSHLAEFLNIKIFSDYCINGLQIEGKPKIGKIVTAVSVSLSVIEAAIQENADAIIAHHGIFWDREPPCLVGFKKNRVAKVLAHNINILGYHLPLDAHPQLGNNILLCEKLGIKNAVPLKSDPLVLVGTLEIPVSNAQLGEKISTILQRKALHCKGRELVSSVAVCSGGAQKSLAAVAQNHVDAYISGEIAEQSYYISEETGTNFYAAGHHATEKPGIMALGEYLAEKFELQNIFVDTENPT